MSRDLRRRLLGCWFGRMTRDIEQCSIDSVHCFGRIINFDYELVVTTLNSGEKIVCAFQFDPDRIIRIVDIPEGSFDTCVI